MRRKRIYLIAIGLCLVTAVTVGYLWLTRDIEAEENNLAVPTLSSTEPRLFLFDINTSSVNFTIDNDVSDVKGTFDLADGWFEIVPEGDQWRIIVVLDIDGNSVDTGNAGIDFFIKVGFQAEKYPIGRFVGEADKLVDDLTVPQTLQLIGNIELSGVTKPISVPMEFQLEADTITASAQLEIDARDFGASFPEAVGSAILDSKIRVIARQTDELPITPQK